MRKVTTAWERHRYSHTGCENAKTEKKKQERAKRECQRSEKGERDKHTDGKRTATHLIYGERSDTAVNSRVRKKRLKRKGRDDGARS